MPSERSIYHPDTAVARGAYVSSMSQYGEMHKRSLDDPEGFWGEIANQFYWETPAEHDRFFDYNFDVTQGPIFTKWLDGATTNVSYNLLDRNIKNGHGDKVAFYWSVPEGVRSIREGENFPTTMGSSLKIKTEIKQQRTQT